MSIPIQAQLSTLRLLDDRASRYNLKRGGFCMRDSEADLIKERLQAAIETLERTEANNAA